MPKGVRFQDTVETIPAAIAHLLVRGGYDGTATNRVAEADGVGVVSLSWYSLNEEPLTATPVERQLGE